MSTPTDVTALARRWRLEINMGTVDVPDWQLCPAIVEFQPEFEPNFEDSGTYDDEGWDDSDKTGMGWKITAKFNRKKSADSTIYHPVHEKLRTTALLGWGADSKIPVRWMDRDGMPEAYQGNALVKWAPEGGEKNDLDQVEVELTGSGKLLEIDNPLAA
ncbi:phage tail tube protein [Streptomyces phaeochromogenes]|uniref:phage tail tube protein n=1 Tax=Streptomyces phaeochromogenes TaxID=1923 RepID=UPI0038688F2D|nr:hypothetical protein OG277_29205 [Streptomyces phaeochromogenes]